LDYDVEARELNFGFNDNTALLEAKKQWLRAHDAKLLREEASLLTTCTVLRQAACMYMLLRRANEIERG
jgi:hypothetical protein